jgi:hypothetical protein
LPDKIISAIRYLIAGRSSIAWWPALKHVHDVNVFAAQSASFDDLIQKFSRASHERFSQSVLFRPWRFTDKNQSGLWITDAENGLCALAG